MARARKTEARPRAAWNGARVVRTTLTGVAAFALAGVAGMSAFAGVVRTRAPAMLPAIWYDPIAPMAQWIGQLAAEPERVRDPHTRDVAVATLRTQPLNAPALRLLAMWEGTQGRADRFAALSERVTRRDFLTQLFLIERAVARNDIPGALAHYDKALRVSPDSRQLLFPILGRAMAEPEIRRELADLVRRQSLWIGGFLFAALDLQGGATSAADLLLDPRIRRDNPLVSQIAPGLLARLIGERDFARAERLFLKLPTANAAMLRDPAFSASTTDAVYGPFSWHVVDNADAGAHTAFEQAGGDRRQLYVAMLSGPIRDAVLVRRILRLAPGEYRFAEARTVLTPGDAPAWQLECLSADKAPVRIWTSSGEARAPTPLRIAPGCTWQQISLVAPGSGAELTIDRIAFERAGPAA